MNVTKKQKVFIQFKVIDTISLNYYNDNFINLCFSDVFGVLA